MKQVEQVKELIKAGKLEFEVSDSTRCLSDLYPDVELGHMETYFVVEAYHGEDRYEFIFNYQGIGLFDPSTNCYEVDHEEVDLSTIVLNDDEDTLVVDNYNEIQYLINDAISLQNQKK